MSHHNDCCLFISVHSQALEFVTHTKLLLQLKICNITCQFKKRTSEFLFGKSVSCSTWVVYLSIPPEHWVDVLVCSGCCNKMPWTEGYTKDICFQSVPEARSLRAGASMVRLGEGSLPGSLRATFLLSPYTGGGGNSAFSSFSYKDANPIMGTLPA